MLNLLLSLFQRPKLEKASTGRRLRLGVLILGRKEEGTPRLFLITARNRTSVDSLYDSLRVSPIRNPQTLRQRYYDVKYSALNRWQEKKDEAARMPQGSVSLTSVIFSMVFVKSRLAFNSQAALFHENSA